jgi:hypothetical protein
MTYEEELLERAEIERQIAAILGTEQRSQVSGGKIQPRPSQQPAPQQTAPQPKPEKPNAGRYVRPPSMMTLLRDVAALPTDEAKIERLISFKHKSLSIVLKCATEGEWMVAEPRMPAKQQHHHYMFDPALDCNYLFDTARRLYIFCRYEGSRPSPVEHDLVKRAKLWESFLLEHGDDERELLLLARRHELLDKLGLSLGVIYSAFPELRGQVQHKPSEAAQGYLIQVIAEKRARIDELNHKIRMNEAERDELQRAREREYQQLARAESEVGVSVTGGNIFS